MSHSVRMSNFVPTIDDKWTVLITHECLTLYGMSNFVPTKSIFLMDSILIYTCDYFQNLFYVLYLAIFCTFPWNYNLLTQLVVIRAWIDLYITRTKFHLLTSRYRM